MKRCLACLIACLLLMLGPIAALAHKPSDSYLRLVVQGQSIQGQWDIALRDLDYALGLDGDGDGLITWGELRARHEAIAAYALSHLQFSADDAPCTSRPVEQLVDYHSDGAYTVLRFSVDCPAVSQAIELRYGLFFDFDSLHRGLLSLEYQGHLQTTVLSPEQPTFRVVHSATFSPWREFFQFVKEGIWHIWSGYDHILFLLSLLLPAVLRWEGGHWQAVATFRVAFLEVLKIVTAFTLAHSFTLSLATLGMVALPSRWVESAIAASVLLAALHNLYPFIHHRLWLVAFAFGLVHGLGFATVLLDLGLPGTSLWLPLAGFNLGVEIGQLVIVSAFLPLAFITRYTWLYQRLIVRVGSLLIALVASIWLLERSLDLDLGGWIR
jgi:hypothetical protein